jgi:toxin ParE1/3/4
VKRVVLRARARTDRQVQVRHYRAEAGAKVAERLVDAMELAIRDLENSPGIGSPALGRALGIDGLRIWRRRGFSLSFWYIERPDQVDIVRLVDQRQDIETIIAEGW